MGTRILLAALTALLAACGARPSGEKPAGGVLLITVDTLRADQLGCYGDPRGLTPNMDRFASTATLFEGAYSQATHTHSALSSVLTGLAPARHGVAAQAGRLRKGIVSVPSQLRSRGIATGSFVANMCKLHDLPRNVFSVGWEERFCGMQFGENGRPTGEQWTWDLAVVEAAEEWIAEQDGPWFAWVHLMDPHAEHRPPADLWPYETRPIRNKAEQYKFYSEFEHARQTPPEGALETLWEQYGAEVRGSDRTIGRLLDFADALEEGRRPTAVLISADHGDELFETWPKYGHGISLTEGVLRVPLIVRAPNLEPGVRTDLVETLQISPTLLQLFDVPAPYELDGRSLLDGDRPTNAAISYCANIATLRKGDTRIWLDSKRLKKAPDVSDFLRAGEYHLALPWYNQTFVAATFDEARPTFPDWIEDLENDERSRSALRLRTFLDQNLIGLGELPDFEVVDDADLEAHLRDLGYGGGPLPEDD